MSGKSIVIDRGSSLKVVVHDRSYGGGYSTLLELDQNNLNLLATGNYMIRGVPLHSTSVSTLFAPITLTSDRADQISGHSEEWLREWTPNLDGLPSTIRVRLGGIVKNAGTYQVRIGGTAEQPDGLIVATLTVTGSGGYPNSLDSVVGPTFTNPGGYQLVKLTGLAESVPTSLRSVAIFLEAVIS